MPAGPTFLSRVRGRIRGWPRPGVAGWALWVVWTVELFVVQELTLVPMHHQSLRSFLTYRIVRFCIDGLACGALLAALPRRALTVLFLLNPLFFVGVIVYRDYFHQPLSLQVVLNQSGEGLSVADALVPLLRAWHLVFLLTLVVKLALSYRSSGARLPWAARREPALALAGGYLGFVALMNPLLQPLYKIGTWDSVSGLGSIYGYLATWSAELMFIDSEAMLRRAIERAERGLPEGPDRLISVQPALAVRERLVFLQIESFDHALLGFRIGDREVTPHMNRIAAKGQRYCVKAPKGTGSADADFKALMGRLPSADVPTYKLPNYPYDGSFVHRLESLGFRTEFVHGVTGEFFNRRPALQKMGFDAMHFREEFERRRGELSTWTLPDDELLEFAAERLRAAPGRTFLMVVTATSHIPFPLDAGKKTFFPGEDGATFAYFDSVHFVDAAIGRFVDALPPETTLVAYGDHISQIENPELGYRQTKSADVGCVPFVVYDSSRDLGETLTPEAKKLADECALDLLETLRFVHRSAEASAASPHASIQ